MTLHELGVKLKEMRDSAPEGEIAVYTHLFGIKYADEIVRSHYSIKDIVIAAGIDESMKTEVRKGINLAKYVELKHVP